jgi:hypothetical protein
MNRADLILRVVAVVVFVTLAATVIAGIRVHVFHG